jgi:thiamine transport system substrate-binding protein
MRRRLLPSVLVLVLAAAVLGTALTPSASAADPTTITLVTHDSFAVSKPVLAAFTKQTGVKVKILQSGDAGAALNQVVLTKSNPIGDVFFGVDNTFLSRALDAGVFAKNSPSALSRVPEEYQLDPSHRLTPVDHGDVCINYDTRWFADEKLAVPTTLDDLTKPEYRGLLVVENPATSSPGLAFQLATIAKYGDDGWRDYWSRLRDNDVKVDDGWESAYDGDFTQGANQGRYPLVVSYASSPPAAVYFSKPRPKTSPIGIMLDSCFRQVEFAGVIKGTEHPAAARKLVDFMLSERFQADIPLQMFVFPVRDGTPLPPVFTKFAEVPEQPLSLPPADISAHRDAWIEQWTDTVLR